MNKILYSFVFFAALFISGCNDSDDGFQDLKNTVTFSESKLTFDVEGSSKTIAITTNKDWTLSCDAEWCSISATSGHAGTTSVIITTEDLPNGSYEDRVATLTVSSEGVTSGNTFTIVQTRFPFLKFDGDTVRLDNSAQYFEVKGKYNYGYKIQKSSWIKDVDPITGRAAMNEYTLKFKVNINIHEERIGKIIVSNYANTVSSTIFVKQAGEFSLTWENIGTGNFYDGYWMENSYDVEIFQAKGFSDFYKIATPYTKFIEEEGPALKEGGFHLGTPSPEIILWVDENDIVDFDNFFFFFSHPNYGPYWAYSPSLFTSGDQTLCKKNGNTITLAPSMYFPLAEGGFGQAYWAENPIEITLPTTE